MKKLIFFVVLSCLSFSVSAAPQLSSISLNASSASEGIYSIDGSGFGIKSQASPVLYDFVEYAYENGIRNANGLSVSDGDRIRRSSQDDNAVWGKPSSPSPISDSGRTRHSLSSRSYFHDTSNNFLGWPEAYGGLNTPNENDQLYVSWWYFSKENQHQYYEFAYSELSGTFLIDEPVEIEGYPTLSAEFIGVDDTRVALRVIDQSSSNLNSSTWDDLLISGSVSGASLRLNANYQTGGFYLPSGGSNKFIRIWEESSGSEGARISWTQDQLTLAQTNESSSLVRNLKTELQGGEWHHLEIFVDLSNNKISRWVNSKHMDTFDIAPARRLSNVSPTIALLGFDGKQTFNNASSSDIYMDTSLQRVVLGNAANWGDVTHSELQLPRSWSNDKIDFDLYVGSLNSEDALHIYVFDENGVMNSAGYPLDEMKSKAQPPKLYITN